MTISRPVTSRPKRPRVRPENKAERDIRKMIKKICNTKGIASSQAFSLGQSTDLSSPEQHSRVQVSFDTASWRSLSNDDRRRNVSSSRVGRSSAPKRSVVKTSTFPTLAHRVLLTLTLYRQLFLLSLVDVGPSIQLGDLSKTWRCWGRCGF